MFLMCKWSDDATASTVDVLMDMVSMDIDTLRTCFHAKRSPRAVK